MSGVRSFIVLPCTRIEIAKFIETNHYSKSINGCITDYCFKLLDPTGELIGAAFFGRMAMRNQWKRFTTNESAVIELRRLCCIDDTPRNTESYFIGQMLKWLVRYTDIQLVVSYADSEYGHQGIIYKASNFTYLGKSPGAKVIVVGDKRYHDKAIRTKYKGELKPFAVKLKEQLLTGEAIYKTTSGKHTYTYNLEDHR